MASGAGEGNLSAFSTSAIPSADNRWRGNNRGGWSNAEYDQLWNAFNATLDRQQQVQQIIRMMQVATNDVTDIFLFFNPRVVAFRAGLTGPALGPPEALKYWAIQDWQLT